MKNENRETRHPCNGARLSAAAGCPIGNGAMNVPTRGALGCAAAGDSRAPAHSRPRRFQDSQPPRNFAVRFSRLLRVAYALEQETQVRWIDFHFFIDAIAEEFAVAERIRPMRGGVSRVGQSRERLLLRR